MKTLHKIFLTFSMLTFSVYGFSQNTEDVKALIERGIALNDSGKYALAIDKYTEALKLDKNNLRAQYEMSYTLSISGRPKDAIPYLEKLAPSNTYPEAYDLLGSIYDDEKNYEKAIAYYKQGLVAFPKYQRLYFNLAISYQRQGKYAEAEANSAEAIKLDPKHASSQRIYALATYSEEKRGISLLAWCSFLLLEPQTKRSAEAYQYVQKILNYGIKQTGEKNITINVSPNDMGGANFFMPMTILSATLDKKDLTKTDSLTLQLKSVFEISENFAGKKGDPFFKGFFSDYFKSLAASGNMPAFARFISFSAYQDDNLKWFKENNDKLKALDTWVTTAKREI